VILSVLKCFVWKLCKCRCWLIIELCYMYSYFSKSCRSRRFHNIKIDLTNSLMILIGFMWLKSGSIMELTYTRQWNVWVRYRWKTFVTTKVTGFQNRLFQVESTILIRKWMPYFFNSHQQIPRDKDTALTQENIARKLFRFLFSVIHELFRLWPVLYLCIELWLHRDLNL